MTIEEYQKGVDRTFNHISPELDLCHCMMGLQTEIGELFDATDKTNLKEEVGDNYWYLGALGNWIDFYCLEPDFHTFIIPLKNKTFYSKNEILIQFIIEKGKLADHVKRFIFYKKEPNWTNVCEQANVCWQLLEHFLNWNDLISVEALNANQAKLRKRFPDKFTEEQAINRNLDLEREALENHE